MAPTCNMRLPVRIFLTTAIFVVAITLLEHSFIIGNENGNNPSQLDLRVEKSFMVVRLESVAMDTSNSSVATGKSNSFVAKEKINSPVAMEKRNLSRIMYASPSTQRTKLPTGWKTELVAPSYLDERVFEAVGPDSTRIGDREIRSLFTVEDVPFKTYELNASLAQATLFNVVVPDGRPKECTPKDYNVNARMTRTSVIIPFHNELWAVIVGTVRSLISNTPPLLLHEIILVDDFSSSPNLQTNLEIFVRLFGGKVKLLRTKAREGLIRSRMFGARYSSGDILVFIDAHVVCGKDWLQPLVEWLRSHPDTIAVPGVDYIWPHTFQYSQSFNMDFGTVNWKLEFEWMRFVQPPEDLSVPFPGSTMIGCAFAVTRESFFRLGEYDDGMDIWGGEHVEISLRYWMCAGGLFYVQCSRVGHVFREHLPYRFSEEILFSNLWRIAEVWLDDYKTIFYGTSSHKRPSPEVISTSSLHRKQLRSRLRCKPFRWFMDHNAPELRPPRDDSIMFGQIKHVVLQKCLSRSPRTDVPTLEDCYYFNKATQFTFTTSLHLVLDGCCLGVNSAPLLNNAATHPDRSRPTVGCSPCKESSDTSQLWLFVASDPYKYSEHVHGDDERRTVGAFTLASSNVTSCLSMDVGRDQDIPQILLAPCISEDPYQQWILTYHILQPLDNITLSD